MEPVNVDELQEKARSVWNDFYFKWCEVMGSPGEGVPVSDVLVDYFYSRDADKLRKFIKFFEAARRNLDDISTQ